MKQNVMKKQSGFTLIELVIVIIILGILAATAVPKFINIQGDAQKAAMKGVKGALEGAASITYSKAALEGKLSGASNTNGLAINNGYPQATSAALGTAAGLAESDWTFDTSTPGTAIITPASITDSTAVTAAKTAVAETGCNVTYIEAASSVARPTIAAYTGGC